MPARLTGSRARKAGRQTNRRAQRAIASLVPARWEVMAQVRRELQRREEMQA